MRSIALALVACAAALPARAANVTIAVMPFKDLSGSQGAIGEAIRETVTTDLKDLSGVKVIERGNLDKILAEQHLQGQRSDLDPSTAAKVGKLLGATLICGGAYQKASPKIRLTARFIKVETGEIVETAKVDGSERDFLKLQDKITVALLKKAGMRQHAQKFEQRARPPSKMNAVELYGQALLADNDDLKHQYLKLAVADDPNFTYAVNDLASLEKRMKIYENNADVARTKQSKEASEQLVKETDPSRYYGTMSQVFAGLLQSRRYRQMAIEARKILQSPPKFDKPLSPGLPAPEELAWFYLLNSEFQLADHDAVLRDGEKFMRKYPASMYFSSAKSFMDQVIQEKHEIEDGKAELPNKLAEIPANQKTECRIGLAYADAKQYPGAREHLHKCLVSYQEKYIPIGIMYMRLVDTELRMGAFDDARKDLAAFEKADPKQFRQMKTAYEYRLPVDG